MTVESFELNVKGLDVVLKNGSAVAFNVIQDIIARIDENNLLEFINVMLYGRDFGENGWLKYENVNKIVGKLRSCKIIKDNNTAEMVRSSNKITAFLILSALERVAENLESFLDSFLRTVWGTDGGSCPECGNQLSSNAMFCDQCGITINNTSWDVQLRKMVIDTMREINEGYKAESCLDVEKNNSQLLHKNKEDLNYII